MSTGGMPEVALKRVESLIHKHEVYLIEYKQIASLYVVQRDKIKQLLGDRFISLGWASDEKDRDHFQEIVEKINPDLIHMEEIPEMFIFGMRKEHSDWLYRKDRSYKIVETTHTMTYNVNNKIYFPDKFLLMCKYSQQEYSKFNIPISVVEYPIEKLEKNQGLAIRKLGLNPDYFHILNVGLFTRDKNQGYLFEIAKKLKEYKIHYHFVGNQAENFKDYWGPLMNEKLDNCFIHGERNDVELFYQAADLLVHPSLLELSPLAVREATSYNLPVYMFNLPGYLDMYEPYKNIKFLSKNINEDSQFIIDNFNIKRKDDNSSFQKSLLDEYENITQIKTSTIETQTEDDYYEYNINFTDGAKVEITGKSKLDFEVEFFDKNTNEFIYQKTIPTNNWCCTNIKYYKEYKINIKHQGEILISHIFNLKGRNVLIQLDSKSIGDTIAWFPYVEEFRKKHDCKVYCSTFWNKWFVKLYPEINFIEPNKPNNINDIYARYAIGWHMPWNPDKNPVDFKKIPLQKAASDILGLEYKEIAPKIESKGMKPIKQKYVCIAQFSTANAKHWHHPIKDSNKGWQILVDWLNEQGYKVMVISKQETRLKNVIDNTGDYPIEQRLNELKWCEFFIGIGSGLSWLAWAMGKKVVMISGFSDPFCEFQSNNINVHNFNVCNGCFNIHNFARDKWNWCPVHENTDRHFECSINITPQMVTEKIISSKLIENAKPFDFEKYDIPIILDRSKISLSYEKEENKISIGYNGDETPELNVSITDVDNKTTYQILADIKLSKDYVIWCVPKTILHEETDKIIVSFYTKVKILDLRLTIR